MEGLEDWRTEMEAARGGTVVQRRQVQVGPKEAGASRSSPTPFMEEVTGRRENARDTFYVPRDRKG